MKAKEANHERAAAAPGGSKRTGLDACRNCGSIESRRSESTIEGVSFWLARSTEYKIEGWMHACVWETEGKSSQGKAET